jgi:1-acylglycerone phosphate reductase
MATITRPDNRPVVVITGCSSGIGRALAIQFAKYQDCTHYHVFATARDVETLRELPPQIERVQLDVTDDVSTNECINSILAQVGRIDILVNNAGTNTAVGPTAEVELDRYRSTMEVNYFGLIRITSVVSRHMISRRSGRIINIGSTVGLVPLPYAAAYCSSKAAVHSYSEALRMELEGFGVQVSIVSPGAIKSSIGERGAQGIVLAKDSNYASVQDMVKCESWSDCMG